jgi:hypothetical protein
MTRRFAIVFDVSHDGYKQKKFELLEKPIIVVDDEHVVWYGKHPPKNPFISPFHPLEIMIPSGQHGLYQRQRNHDVDQVVSITLAEPAATSLEDTVAEEWPSQN